MTPSAVFLASLDPAAAAWSCCFTNSFGTKSSELAVLPQTAETRCTNGRRPSEPSNLRENAPSFLFMHSYVPKYKADEGNAPNAAGPTPQ